MALYLLNCKINKSSRDESRS